MTDTGADALRADGTSAQTYTETRATSRTRTTGWVGWVFFAGIMMITLGAFQAIEGLVALLNDTYYLVGSSGLVISLDYTAWGWVHLILGVVAVLIGLGVLAGSTAARIGGILLAVLSAIVNLTFIAAYPLWSIIVIAIDVIVIYALAVHGREVRSA
jgi:hypothetical protein